MRGEGLSALVKNNLNRGTTNFVALPACLEHIRVRQAAVSGFPVCPRSLVTRAISARGRLISICSVLTRGTDCLALVPAVTKSTLLSIGPETKWRLRVDRSGFAMKRRPLDFAIGKRGVQLAKGKFLTRDFFL